ncbi:MAG: ketopantoate reductase family protein [Candidatus Heimdallarchaeota archaeon]
MKKYKVAVVGAGPTGGILAVYLKEKGLDVTLVDIWKEHMDAIEQQGLQIFGTVEKTVKFEADKLKRSVKELAGLDVDLVFIAVKTPFLKIVLENLKGMIPDNSLIVSHQNGAGTEELIAEAFGRERAFRDIINFAGNILGPGRIDMTFFNPPNYIGAAGITAECYDRAQEIANVMTSPEFPVKFLKRKEFMNAVWMKVILNSSLSPVCAITDMTMAEALAHPGTRNVVSNIITEGITVTNAEGIEFEPDFHDVCMAYLEKGGHHRPSMLIDIELKKPTEIAFLNGKIVEMGRKHQISVPYNEATCAYIEALESKF